MLRCWKFWESVASGLCSAGCRSDSSACFSFSFSFSSPSCSCLFSLSFSKTDSVTMTAGCWRICSKMKSGKSDKSVGSMVGVASASAILARTPLLAEFSLCTAVSSVFCAKVWKVLVFSAGSEAVALVGCSWSSFSNRTVCASFSWCKRAFWRKIISSYALRDSTSALVGRPLLRLGGSATWSASTSAFTASASDSRAFAATIFFAARSSFTLSNRSLFPAWLAE